MNAYIQLTLAQLRLFARNRQVLLWMTAFPIFFMIMLGTFLGKDNPVSVTGAVLDQDQSALSQSLVQSLQSDPVLKLTPSTDLEQELAALENGNQQLVLVIPQGYEQKLKERSQGPQPVQPAVEVQVYYDQTNTTASTLGLQLLAPVIDRVDKELAGYTSSVVLKPQGVQSLQLRYIDFLVPGILAMMIMSNNLNGVSGQIASWRERGILRRMQSTTLKASTFIASQITARLVLNGLQAVLVLLVGYFLFGTQVNGSWLLLLSFIVLGTLAFMATGFIVAGIAKTPESAGPIAGFLSFPMMFVGGVFFPIQNMPEFLQPLVRLIPITHLSTALRQVMNVGTGLGGLWVEALFLGGWLVVAFAVATWTFKWE
ncbi:ABC transporter permease [Paenibacillus sp. YYML68]|uniref:ABC transporter permease n=1 Tax=Paenibacillus sp. YYML68 TaxID=2909250 RepID=UPI00248F7AB5|nr:ABC transporter permease [Paenibacillus sp. YYML68]